MKKRLSAGLAAVAVAALLFVVITPMIGKGYIPEFVNTADLPEDRVQAILSAEQGYYSANTPFFAAEIQLLETTEDRILYRVFYFPFGSIERSYVKEPDGNWVFNLERPLFGFN